MYNKISVDDNIIIRRVIKQDLQEIEFLYKKQGRDAIWLKEGALLRVLEKGEIWACVYKNKIITCGGICTLQTKLPLIEMAKTQDIPFNTNITLMPVAGNNVALKYLLNFLNCRIAGKFHGENYSMIIPAKTGLEYACTCLKNDMVLVAMRPLLHLRINYIFLSKAHIQTDEKNSIIINMNDSLALSRYLDKGYCATSETLKNITLEKVLKNKEC